MRLRGRCWQPVGLYNQQPPATVPRRGLCNRSVGVGKDRRVAERPARGPRQRGETSATRGRAESDSCRVTQFLALAGRVVKRGPGDIRGDLFARLDTDFKLLACRELRSVERKSDTAGQRWRPAYARHTARNLGAIQDEVAFFRAALQTTGRRLRQRKANECLSLRQLFQDAQTA